MRGFVKFAWLPVIAMTMSAATLNLSTGTANWQVTQTLGTQNGPALNTVGSAAVLTGTLPFAANLPGFESFAWANPFGGAVWIGQLATDGQFSNGGSITCGSPCGAQGGTYIYTLSFAAPLGGNLTLSGFTADNGVRELTVMSGASTLYSCNVLGPGNGTQCAATQNQVTATTGVLNYGSGTVTITARVQNLDGPGRNPSGFILSGVANTVDNVIPEPSTYAMLGLGGAALLFSRLRRK